MCKVSFEYDSRKKELAKKYLKKYGLSMKDAMSIFLDAVVMNKGMPNTDALEDAEDSLMATKAIDEGKYSSAEDVYKRLGI